MKIFINSMLNFAFKSAVKRDKWDAVNVMVSHGMSHRKATIFIEAFSQDTDVMIRLYLTVLGGMIFYNKIG